MGEAGEVEEHGDHHHDEEPFGVEQVPHTPRERWLEFGVTFLLGFAALMSAWAVYQSQSYSGRQNQEFRKASALHVESVRIEARAGKQALGDLAAFQEWFGFAARGEDARAEMARARFRHEMRPAFDAWLASDPFENPDADASPFETPRYKLAASDEAVTIRARALDLARQGERSDSMADRYVLLVVLLALGMFLLGVQSRVGIFELRAGLAATAAVVVIGSTLWMIVVLPTSWPT